MRVELALWVVAVVVTGGLTLSSPVSGHELVGLNGTEMLHIDFYRASSPAEDPLMVGLTLIESAGAKGAVCLDGTLPGYHVHRGSGSGANSWLIQLE
ncbi:hypothetical protein CRG98_031443, partial [Punica granatum]